MSVAPKYTHKTAKIYEHGFCGDCGWPLIFACCNDGMAVTAPYQGNDYWLYCSNKTCKNHQGESIFQELPDWAVRFKA